MNPNFASAEKILGSAGSFLRILVDNLPDYIFIKDTESRILFSNVAHARALGANCGDEVVGKTDFDFFSREMARQYHTDEQTVVNSGQVLNREETSINPATGETRWLQTTKMPLRDGAGKVVAIAGISRDITERKKTEGALHMAKRMEEQASMEALRKTEEAAQAHQASVQSQRLLEALLENMPDLIYFKDTESRFLKCSRSQAARLGCSDPAQVIGKSDFDFHPPQKAKEFRADEERIIRTGEPLINKIEKKIGPEGETWWTSTTKVPIRESDGSVIGIVGINRDVTSQIKTEEALRQTRDDLEQRIAERTAAVTQERRLLRTLIDNLPDAIYAKDREGRKTLANTADLRNMRCKFESEALGKTDFDLFPPEIAQRFWADDQLVVQQGMPVLDREEYFFNDDGDKRWLLSSKLPLRDENGVIVGLIGIGRDITSLKKAELKLEAVHKELVQASRQAGMAEVATGVLHNVGNVLNSMNVSVSMIAEKLRISKMAGVAKVAKLLRDHKADLTHFLSEDERGRQVPGYLDQLAEHLERERDDLGKELQCLIQNIGHIKQVIATQQDYARVAGVIENVMLPELLEDAMKIHASGYMRHGVTVIKDYEPLPEIFVDKHKVMQILVNLLSNAKYACDAVADNQEKRVVIRLRRVGDDRVRLEVEDNGMGIPQENLTRIFSQGFTTRKGGHGFGLHSGALAARELNGTLSVHSDGPGKGARFTLELPLKQHDKK